MSLKMSQSEKISLGPTHACPVCGEWFEVEEYRRNTWLVSPFNNEDDFSAQVWAEAADMPLCPYDASALERFLITED